MEKRGKNRPVLSLTDYKILEALLKQNKQINIQLHENIKISEIKISQRLVHLKEIGLVKRKRIKNKRGVVNYIETKNHKKILDFFKILNENTP
jgi:predicted transcriptional regulator